MMQGKNVCACIMRVNKQESLDEQRLLFYRDVIRELFQSVAILFPLHSRTSVVVNQL